MGLTMPGPLLISGMRSTSCPVNRRRRRASREAQPSVRLLQPSTTPYSNIKSMNVLYARSDGMSNRWKHGIHHVDFAL